MASGQTTTTVYLDATQYQSISQQNADIHNAMVSGLAAANSSLAASQNYGLSIYNLANSANGALQTTVGQLGTATATFQSVAAAMNSGNWANLNNNLVAFNAGLSGVRNDLQGGLQGLTNAMSGLPNEMSAAISAVINTALVGISAANSNLANSTNLANLAGLAALTNLAGVIVLTNIITELELVNSNLLSLTNLGLSSSGIQDMAEAIGASITNATLYSGTLTSNALLALKEPMQTNAWFTEKQFTNAMEQLQVLKEGTNWLVKILGELGKHSLHWEVGTNLLFQLKGQGEEATSKRADIKLALERLVQIQTTNVAAFNVTLTNYPNYNSETLAADGIAARLDALLQINKLNAGEYVANTQNVENPIPYVVVSAGLGAATGDGSAAPVQIGPLSDMAVIAAIPGYGNISFDFNPMNSMFAPFITAFRSAMVWVCTLCFLVACAKIIEKAVDGMRAPQLHIPNVTVAGNSVPVAAPQFVFLYVGFAAAYSLAIYKVFDGSGVSLAQIQTASPFNFFASSGPAVQRGLALANCFLPLVLILGQAVWIMTSRYSVLFATWVYLCCVRFLLKF